MKFSPREQNVKVARVAPPSGPARQIFYEICENTPAGAILLVSPRVQMASVEVPTEAEVRQAYRALIQEGALFVAFLRQEPWAEAVVFTQGHLIPVQPEAFPEIFPPDDLNLVDYIAGLILQRIWPEWPPTTEEGSEAEEADTAVDDETESGAVSTDLPETDQVVAD